MFLRSCVVHALNRANGSHRLLHVGRNTASIMKIGFGLTSLFVLLQTKISDDSVAAIRSVHGMSYQSGSISEVICKY